jgi:hypothetical protein
MVSLVLKISPIKYNLNARKIIFGSDKIREVI